MYGFKKLTPARSVMFAVNYDDGHTAYLVVQHHGTTEQDYLIPAIARERQAHGELREGAISNIRRVR